MIPCHPFSFVLAVVPLWVLPLHFGYLSNTSIFDDICGFLERCDDAWDWDFDASCEEQGLLDEVVREADSGGPFHGPPEEWPARS